MPKISQIDQVTCQAEVRILQKTTLKFATTALTISWIVLESPLSFTLSAILTREFEWREIFSRQNAVMQTSHTYSVAKLLSFPVPVYFYFRFLSKCDVTLSSNYRFHLEFCGRLWLHCWRLRSLLEWRRWIMKFKSCNLHFSWNGDLKFNIRDVEFSLFSFNLFKVTSSSNDAISTWIV